MAGAGSADAVTNANAAVLAHSEVSSKPQLTISHWPQDMAGRLRVHSRELQRVFGECGRRTEFHFSFVISARSIAATPPRMDGGMAFGHTQPSLRNWRTPALHAQE
jgi:hypothetical protein